MQYTILHDPDEGHRLKRVGQVGDFTTSVARASASLDSYCARNLLFCFQRSPIYSVCIYVYTLYVSCFCIKNRARHVRIIALFSLELHCIKTMSHFSTVVKRTH